MRKSKSRKIALCGVLGALSIVLMLLGNLLQIGTYCAPMLACFLLLPVLEEYGPRYALLLYAGTAILALILVPDKELALFYTLVLGYYPVLKQKLDGIRPVLLRAAAKLCVFNLAVAALYALLLLVFASPALLAEFADGGRWMLAAMLLLGNLCFFLCDRAIDAITRLYHLRLRARMKNLF